MFLSADVFSRTVDPPEVENIRSSPGFRALSCSCFSRYEGGQERRRRSAAPVPSAEHLEAGSVSGAWSHRLILHQQSPAEPRGTRTDGKRESTDEPLHIQFVMMNISG